MTPKTELPEHVDPRLVPPPGQRTFTSQELFKGADEIVVVHNGAHYRLRVTRQDKLILTK
ncbi:hemin uptake protein HemP [Devosia beringensis]|uniref:hemin uptake protein HemP n=1 Tax=Devosia beringensis TaxID=2657486 RepID=UPI00186B7DBD|nr:hemin uptake protein HemP [Devosia beringensis]